MRDPILTPKELRKAMAAGRIDQRGVAKVLASVGIVTATIPHVIRPAAAQDTWLKVFTWSGYDIPELPPAIPREVRQGTRVLALRRQ